MYSTMCTLDLQELDKRWRISTETAIKAKSIKGYKTYNRKLTENKFKAGEAKPELLDDWYVTTSRDWLVIMLLKNMAALRKYF